MPIYDYHCDNCKNTFEAMNTIKDSNTIICTVCRQNAHKVIINTPLMRMATVNSKGQWVGDTTKELKKSDPKRRNRVYNKLK